MNTKSVLFYTVKWRKYLGEVDYQHTINCKLFFKCCLKNYKHIFNFVKVINRNVSFFYLGYNKNGFFDDVKITSALRSDMAV